MLIETTSPDCSSTHNNTLQVLQRTTIGTSPPKDSYTCEKVCMTASFTVPRIISPVPPIILPVPRIILPVSLHESDRSCMCVLWVSILTLSLRFFFCMISELFRHCSIVCFFYFILININIKSH